ncbi:DASH complex subunit spc19 [Aspergillus lentulus]|uniref:DASH complex subunit SPC19 n=1 Tax=Aspergillus lentulus TaxID=293939 RepID=A0AAN5YYX0_ASPLE|nr:hypothetical protein CNMCM6069_009098 [Aspergillus lentulus]KAF4164873.1 hypothetical protein CNMCM6936_008557 [Aspergillus lentulus]KAF4174287.1 hypothetical protein CNMCM8060_008859 [Aspergillus lentulus]KAF4189204.1 hypothetical protein CNMCM7927_009205 [Aspergillus lentulus]KAF4195229.1 hypothetical protein CNMCM8694_006535 [Aspergillus lentulus]
MAASLQASVDSLQSSLQTLDSSISTLDSAVSDFPRLCKVLQTTRHFELLPEPTLREAQQLLLDEITPSIAHLLSLASNHVEKLSRREQALKAKCELQEGRLHSNDSHQSSSRGLGAMRDRHRQDAGSAVAKAAEYRRLVQKKERLKYTVERLELQSQQRERQLRKKDFVADTTSTEYIVWSKTDSEAAGYLRLCDSTYEDASPPLYSEEQRVWRARRSRQHAFRSLPSGLCEKQQLANGEKGAYADLG